MERLYRSAAVQRIGLRLALGRPGLKFMRSGSLKFMRSGSLKFMRSGSLQCPAHAMSDMDIPGMVEVIRMVAQIVTKLKLKRPSGFQQTSCRDFRQAHTR